MRPVPQSKHLLAVMILAAVAATSGYLASLDHRFSSSQANTAAAALKRHEPSAFPYDPILGERPYWRLESPAFHALLELVLVPTGYGDPILPFRALAGVLTMVFLCGMYALVNSECRSWSVSVFVAILSCRVVETLGGGVWGMGSLASITPQGVFVAILPLVVLAFLRYSGPLSKVPSTAQWRLLLVFGSIGLMGNIHLVTAMNLTVVLLLVYVARQRFALASLPVALGCGVSAIVAALPYAGYYLGLRAVLGRWEPLPTIEVVQETFGVAGLGVLYPHLLGDLLHWRLLAGALVLGLPAAAAAARIERFRTPHLGVWMWMMIGSLLTAFGLQGASQLAGMCLRTAPPVIDFVQASSLVMLPLYVLLAHAITGLFRLLRAHRAMARWACGALLIGWMLPSDNLRVARWAIADTATMFMDEPDKPAYVLRHHEEEARRNELLQIARWASDRPGSIYVTDCPDIRMLAGRPIIAAPEDVRYLYYLAPGRLEQWNLQRFRKQQALFPRTGRVEGQAVRAFVLDLVRHDPPPPEIREWYIILPAKTAPEGPGPLEIVPEAGWGRHYRLYRLPLTPATAPVESPQTQSAPATQPTRMAQAAQATQAIQAVDVKSATEPRPAAEAASAASRPVVAEERKAP